MMHVVDISAPRQRLSRRRSGPALQIVQRINHCEAICPPLRCTNMDNVTVRFPAPQASPTVSQHRNPATHTTGAQPPPRQQLPPTLYVCQTPTRRPQAKPRHKHSASNKPKPPGTRCPPQAC
ncbi:hypothetical protein [Arthrobacter methylotrophus]|uniref:hypothetical protein n=1 Tax=Arthrobacter methylotrophus TaxID=121291 RepID=UPI0031F14351